MTTVSLPPGPMLPIPPPPLLSWEASMGWPPGPRPKPIPLRPPGNRTRVQQLPPWSLQNPIKKDYTAECFLTWKYRCSLRRSKIFGHGLLILKQGQKSLNAASHAKWNQMQKWLLGTYQFDMHDSVEQQLPIEHSCDIIKESTTTIFLKTWNHNLTTQKGYRQLGRLPGGSQTWPCPFLCFSHPCPPGCQSWSLSQPCQTPPSASSSPLCNRAAVKQFKKWLSFNVTISCTTVYR